MKSNYIGNGSVQVMLFADRLDAQAVKMSDNEAALALNNGSKKLFRAMLNKPRRSG